MSKRTKTAGKTAKGKVRAGGSAKGNATEARALATPGTRAAVRAAALTPRLRDDLAQWLQDLRRSRRRGLVGGVEFTSCANDLRADAIRISGRDCKIGRMSIPMGADDYILLLAGARLLEMTPDEMFADWVGSEIEALLDVASSETGKREIPLTRYERAAVDRIRRERASRAVRPNVARKSSRGRRVS